VRRKIFVNALTSLLPPRPWRRRFGAGRFYARNAA